VNHRFDVASDLDDAGPVGPASAESVVAELVDHRYRVIATLGTGAMGVVHLAEDISLGRNVALKLIRPAYASDPVFLKMFRTEARTLAQIRHENVVQVHAFGAHGRELYLVMEHVEGETLERVSRGRPMDAERALAIVHRVAQGLSAVHARGLVHQDVKPSNIIIEKATGRPVLIDFGLARRATGEPADDAAGTPAYMAPEQARGLESTARTDVYALACTMFELLTGYRVFEGADSRALMKAHVTRPPPPLSARRVDLSHLDPVFARALAKAPEERHPTPLAFFDDIEAAMERAKRAQREQLRQRRSRRPPDGVIRVVVLERDAGSCRQIVRLAERTLSAAGDATAIECATSPAELSALVAVLEPDILIIDDETADGAVAELLAVIRPHAPEVVVLKKAFDRDPTTPPLPVREIAKPINPHVLASLLSQLATRLVRERVEPAL
jgi:serine/threonine protein kinase